MIITRYHNTTTLHLTVEFLTPTFLGGADQNAELRTAPFKNLLRQWWRVAVGSQHNTLEDMRKAEGDLFGSVLDESNERGKKKEIEASASKVRISLTCDDENCVPVEEFINLGKTYHKNVEDKKTGKKGMEISNAVYLGFGPLSNPPKKYILPGSKAELTLTLPKSYRNEIIEVLQMIDAFGAIGSRSRNGWGSLSLISDSFSKKQPWDFNETVPLEVLVGLAVAKEYPSKLGTDATKRLLCWETKFEGMKEYDWKAIMQILAKHYLELRTSLNLKDKDRVNERHILGYPVTHHNELSKWGGKNGRMPSQLRLMVKRNQEGQLVGRILHLPHKLPKQWDVNLGQELDIWKKIHAQLDANKQFRRCGSTK